MIFSFRTELPDSNAYYNLFQSAGWNTEGLWTSEMLQEAVRNSWYIVSVYEGEGNRLVASGRILSDGVVQCLICEMIVLPAYQKQGLGTAVMENLISHCRDKGIRWIQLSAAKGKQGFYENFGFTVRPADAPGMSLLL